MQTCAFHIVLYLLSTIFTIQTFAQSLPNPLVFEQVIIPGTIRSSEIADMLQDPEGSLWIAADGLFHYDGTTFTRHAELPDSGSIGGREINSLFYDKFKKRLLIATRNYGIVEYNYQTNSLKAIPTTERIPIINQLDQTPDGVVWATSSNSGLFKIEDELLKKFTINPDLTAASTSLLTHEDVLLVGGLRKIFFVRDNVIFDSLNLKWREQEFTIYGRVTAMAIDKNNLLYIGTERQGLLIYDLSKREFIKYFQPTESPFYNRINKIFIDQQGLVWILTKSGGLIVYSVEADQYLTAIRNPLSSYSLSGDNCTTIIQDKTGIIWVGATGALNKYDPIKIKFQHFTNDPLNGNSLSDKMVRGIYENDEGNLLIGTDGGFINLLDRKTNTIKRIKISVPGNDKRLAPMHFEKLDETSFLIGTNAGLLVANKNLSLFSFFKPLEPTTRNKMVRQLIVNNQKIYAIVSGSFLIYDQVSRTTTTFTNFAQGLNQRATNATTLFQDSKGRIWIGVRGGVSMLNEDESFTYFPIEHDPVRPDGSYFMVLTINEIGDKLWIGTFNSGLWQIDPNRLTVPEKSAKRIDIPELNSNTIYATLEDSDHHVWISTNQGILKYELKSKSLTQFSVAEGVQDLEFNRLAYLKMRSGEISFGGINGINIFDPDKITTSQTLVSPVILSVSGFKDLNKEFFINLRGSGVVNLDANQNQLTFTILIPNYQQPATYTVEYFLENQDAHWNPATDNTISYSYLKPGSYNFQVRTKYKGEIVESDSIVVTIAHPFWQTWWFITLSVAVLVVATYLGIKAYAAKTRRDKELLEKLLKERTAEIEKSKEELEILNQKKDLIFSILSHDLRSPLTTLKGFLSIIIENVDALPKEAIKKHARSIRNSVSSSLDLIDNTLYWSMSQTGSIAYTPANFSITDALRKIFNLYQLTAEKKRIHFHLSIAENIDVHGDENMVYVALRNLVSNALKFTSEGKNVHISASRNHQYAIIKIADEGIGMDNNYIEKLLADEQLSLKIGTANEKGTGLGLILCKKFVQLNQGELNIVSAENTGTEFTVSLPLAT